MSGEECYRVSSTAGTGDIRCPFFVAHGGREIMCEGIIPGARNSLKFETLALKENQQHCYCECNYSRCEMYLAIMHFKWPEE